MSVYRRNGIFYYDFRFKGRRYRGSTGETRKVAAQFIESSIIKKVQESRNPNPLAKAPLLRDFAPNFLRFVKQCVAAQQLSASTENTYRYGWLLLEKDDIAGRRIDDIRTVDAAVLKFPGSPSNANMALRTLHRILSYASEIGLLIAAPEIPLLEEAGRERLIEPWQEEMILQFAPASLASLFTIMMDCGLRPEEARRMRWENIFWDRGRILVPSGKSLNARRYVEITDRMLDVLRGIKAAQQKQPSEWVFPSRSKSGHWDNSNQTWVRTASRIIKELERRKGLGESVGEWHDDLVLYSARHTFATNFLKAGGLVTQLQVLLGHASITTTMKYVHMVSDGSGELMNEFNRKRHGLRIVRSA